MNAQSQQQYDIFVSYSKADHAWVEGYLLDALAQANIRYLVETAFTLGAPRLFELERAVRQSKRVLLVISSTFLADNADQFMSLLSESYGLQTSSWPVITLIIEPVPLPTRLAMLVSLTAVEPEDKAIAISTLCQNLQHPVPVDMPSKPTCPYPGMVPFSEADSQRFFGRDNEVDEIIERLRLFPFITVIGASGAGKSSLVFAGVVPKLKKSGLFGDGTWQIQIIRPGETPLTTLQAALNKDGFAIDTETGAKADGVHRLLIIDQFEELFTVTKTDDVMPFLETVQTLIRSTPLIYIILTVRADFYTELMQCPLWPNIQANRIEIVPLGRDEMCKIIVQPAESVGVYVEPALVERLISDAADEPGILPLVQETLVLLWEKLERRFLPLRAYEALILPTHAYLPGYTRQTGLQVAIVRRADAALAALTPEEKVIAQRIFLRLVQFGEGRPDTRRQQPVSALSVSTDAPAVFGNVLEHLVQARLLTSTGETNTTDRKIDIAHEALIQGWPTLQAWIQAKWEAEQSRRRLLGKVAEWIRLGKVGGGLLDEIELLEATRWLASAEVADLGTDEMLQEFVQASQNAIEGEKQEKEATRHRELAQAHALAEAQMQRAEEQARANRRLRERAVLLALVSIVMVVAAVFAIVAQQQAQMNAEQAQMNAEQARTNAVRSESLRMAAEAGVLIPSTANNAELAAMLALISLRTAPSTQAEEALAQASMLMYTRRRMQHQNVVTGVVFSPDGKLLLTGSADGTACLWDVASGDVKKRFVIPGDPISREIYSVAFSPDGKKILTGSRDSVARLWDIETGQVEQTFVTGSTGDIVRAVAFSPDGKLIATGGNDAIARIWDAKTGQRITEFTGHTDAIRSIAFSHSGFLLLTGSVDTTVRLWDAGAGELRMTLYGHQDYIWSVAFSQDDTQVLTGSADNTARLWDITGDEAQELHRFIGHMGYVRSAAFSPDGKSIATASDDTTARLWDIASGRVLRVFSGHTGYVWGVAFSPDGTQLATGSYDSTVRLWYTGSTAELRLFINPLDQSASGTASAPKGIHCEKSAEDRGINAIVYSPDGQAAYSAGNDWGVRRWNIDSVAVQRQFVGHTCPVYSLALSTDGTRLLTTSADMTLRVWNTGTGKELFAPLQHDGPVWSVDLSPDGNRAVTGSTGNGHATVRIWDVKQGVLIRQIQGLPNAYSVAFSPDGQSILAGTEDNVAYLLDASTGQIKRRFYGPRSWIWSVRFSPDGKWVLAGSDDNSAYLIDFATGGVKYTWTHTGYVRSAVFSPNGHYILTSSVDGTIYLLNTVTGKTLRRFTNYGSPVRSVVFSPDGKQFLVGDDDGNVRRLDIDVADLLKFSCTRIFRDFTADERTQYGIAGGQSSCPPVQQSSQ